MIFELIVSVVVGVIVFLLGLLPAVSTPDWVGNISAQLATVVDQMAPLGVWLPFGAAGNATLLVLVAVAASATIRLVRLLLSLFTGGGGST